jgi:uncharacterized membrane protein (UPF0182 family)
MQLHFMAVRIFGEYRNDPSTFGGNTSNQPPYYTTMQLPGESKESFKLTTPFVPRGGR